MTRKDIYTSVLIAVCDVCELTPNEVIGSQKERCVDAKYMLVTILSQQMNDDEIAEYLGMTRQGVNYLRNQSKRKPRVGKTLQMIVKQLASINVD